jgi:hypothetical protein
MSGKKANNNLDCVLLNDSNQAFIAGLGPKINF